MTKRLLGLVLAVLLLVCSIPMLSLTVGAAKTRGDANGDDSIDMKDVLLIRKSIANMGVSLNEIAADANADESIDMKDVLLIRKFIANMGVELAPMPEEPSEPSDVSEPSETSAPDATTTVTASETTTTAEVTTTTEEITTTVTTTTTAETTTTTQAPPDSPVIFDADVTAQLRLMPGAQYNNTSILQAFRNETARHGVADQYVITVTGSISPSTAIYPIVIGNKGGEAWPLDGSLEMSTEGSTVTATVNGKDLSAGREEPAWLYFYAEGKNNLLTLTHIKIEAVRRGETTAPTTATTAAPTTTRALDDAVTLNYSIVEEAPRYTNNTITGSCAYNRGETATIKVVVKAYQDLNTQDMAKIRGFVSLTGATLSGDPVVGELHDHQYPITYTYTAQMNDNVTVTGTIASPIYEPSTVTADGQGGGTTPTTTTTTKAVATTTTTNAAPSATTTTTKATTTTTAAPVVGDGYRVQLNITYEAPRYTKTTRTDWWTVAKGSTVNLEITFPVYRPNTDNAAKLPSMVALSANGTPLTVTYDISPVEVEQSADVTFKASFTANADTTITGTIDSGFKVFVAKVNGAVGTGGVTGGLDDVYVVKSNSLIFDQVMLSFYDTACTQYGLAWHTYKESKKPVLQYVEGTVTNAATFAASAQTVDAYATTMTDSGEVYADYNPTNNWSFTVQELVSKVPDYTHKAVFPKGLKANTTYSYRVGDATKGEYGEIYTFTTKSSATDGFTFLFTSDNQWTTDNTAAGSKMTTLLGSMLTAVPNPAFLQSGGDMVDHVSSIHLWGGLYGKNASLFFSKVPTFGNTGNHDSATSMQSHFALESTKAWYSYNYQNTHFIVLDNGSSAYENSLGTEQLNWLKDDLSKAKSANYDWIIVTFHKPLYAPLQWNQNKDTWSELDKTSLRSELMPLFLDAGVDLVLQAHTHQYGRSYPMTGTTTFQTNFTTTNVGGVNYYGNLQGPIFTVMGCGYDRPDHALEDRNPSYTENAYMAVAKDGEKDSFGAIQITPDEITVRVYHDGTSLYEQFGLKK